MRKEQKLINYKLMPQVSATVAFAALAFIALGSLARAEGSAVPGRSVGHVFLGMDRADVWKILGKPGHTATVPHGMSLYGEDDWSNSKYMLTVISERDKVIQVEFNSPRITTTDGLSTKSTLAQVRRHHPALTVRAYTFVPFVDTGDHIIYGTNAFYLDNVREGVAFVFTDQEGVTVDSLNDPLNKIIVHRSGYPAMPVYEDHWPKPQAANDDLDGMRLMRSWFTPRSTGVQPPANFQTPPQSPLPVADFEQAPHRILPGQGVDGVSLGTNRADIWKQMGKPSSTEVVLHGTHSYTADLWVHHDVTVTITFEQERVVQIGFDNINYMANDGSLVLLSLAKVRPQHSALTVTCYDLKVQGSTVHQYYMDDVRRGIAYLYSKIGDITPEDLDCCGDKILVHPPGVPALPIYNKHWTALEPPTEDPNGLRQMRLWFTPQKGDQ